MERPRRMPFGKFKGWLIAELPDEYLDWLASLDNLRAPLRGYVDDEVDVRRECRKPPEREHHPPFNVDMACRLVDAGRKTLALQHHPDRGGDLATMQLVNATADALLSFLQWM